MEILVFAKYLVVVTFDTFVYFVIFVERGVAKRESELHKQTSLAQATTSHQILGIISVTRDAK